MSFHDERVYYQLAKDLTDGMGYTLNGELTAYRPVGYPYFLSLLMFISDSIIFLKTINILSYILAILIYYKILVRHTREVALYFVIIASIYPLAVYSSGILVPQGLAAVSLALIIYFVLQGTKSSIFIASIIYGIALLNVPGLILILPAFVLYIYFDKTLLTNKVILLFLFLIGIILITMPWSYRNSKLFHQPVFISTNGGLNLLLGNSENARYDTGALTDIAIYYDYAVENKFNEAERDNYFKEEAVAWIRDNPYDAFSLYFGKVLNYFHYTNTTSTEVEEIDLKNIISFISYYPILLLAFIRILWYKRFPISKLEGLFYLLYTFNAFASAIFFTRIRFRIPFDYLLIALASYGLFYLKNIIMDYQFKKSL